jgi:hypothetical protein
MSQQHAQFEEEFHDGPSLSNAYQNNYVEPPSATYTTPILPQQLYVNMPAQKLQVHPQSVRQAGTGIGARVVLAIFSMIFIFGMFVVALAIGGGGGQESTLFALSVIFAFVFAFVVLLINLIVNLVSLKR